MRELLRRIGWLFRRDRFDRELEEEMRHHLALKAEAAGGEGAALRQFGNITLLKEDSRAMWTFAFWEQLLQDVRYGLRSMAANKLFSAMAVLSLALGIGANTAIYSFMDAILMRSLPVPHPEELAVLNWLSTAPPAVVHGLNGTSLRNGKSGMFSPNFPFPAYEMLRENKDVVSALFGYAPAYELNLVARNQAEVARGLYVSGNFFSGLGIAPAAGRMIGEEDDRSGAAPVAVITYQYWQSRFAADPSVIGQSILINNIAFTIAGVGAPEFFGVDGSFAPTVFLPLHSMPIFSRKPEDEARRRFLDRNFYWVQMMGRLRPGVSLEQAQSVFGGLFHQYADSTAVTGKEKTTLPVLRVEGGAGGLDFLRRRYSKPLYVLMSMVGLILVIACANIANLLLARAAARRREFAIRLSLGAGRARVIRQLLTESVLLSFGGGMLGLLVAMWAIRSITWLLSDGHDDMALRATLDWPVLGFTAGLVLLTGILFGLAPAIQATGGPVAPALKEAGGGWSGRRRIGLGHTLLIGQIAISLLLVIAASLFVRTLSNLHSVELGFDRENLLIFSLNARQAGYKDEALAGFYGDLASRFRHIPGVRSASFSNFPLVAGYWNDQSLTIPGAPAPAGKRLSACVLSVDESFLSTMQTPVVLGREIQEREIASPHVAVVNQVFAAEFFPGQNPLGRHIGIGNPASDLEIIGVAKTALYNSLKEETPALVYIPYTQNLRGLGGVWFELRTAGSPMAVAGEVRRIVQRAAANVPIANMKTQTAQIDQTIAQERTFASLCACFAALALVIACVGLYGTMTYAAARRTREVGIRMALGAQRRSITWMMLRQVLALAALGLTIGLMIAWQTAHLVGSFLFGVKPADAIAVWGSAGILLLVALVAGYAPARRAARVDPVLALRNE
jgi:macrolide transport system ATP-binding/permease protein